MYFPGVHGNHSRLNYYIMMSYAQNGQTEDNKIGVCCFPTRHTVLNKKTY